MSIKKVKEFVEYFNTTTLTKMEVSENDFKICLEKNNNIKENNIICETNDNTNNSPFSQVEEISGYQIKSPLIGTFYSAPSPEANCFVKIGQKVKSGDTIGIIEAMKVMNEIKSEKDGIVKDILINDGELVEYNQTLVVVE